MFFTITSLSRKTKYHINKTIFRSNKKTFHFRKTTFRFNETICGINPIASPAAATAHYRERKRARGFLPTPFGDVLLRIMRQSGAFNILPR